MRDVADLLARRDGFVLAGHRDPDGDSLGSALALATGLEQLGKRAVVVSVDEIPVAYRGLPGMARVVRASRLPEGYPVAILVECNGIERSGLEGFEGRTLVNIDHHANNPEFGDLNWIDPDVAAVGVMVHELLTALGVDLTPEMATQIYLAVLTDTGSFRYSNTDARTLRLAADLVDAGVDPSAVASAVYENVSLQKVRLMGEALRSLTLEDDGRLAWMHLGHEAFRRAGPSPDTEGIVNQARAVEGVSVAVFFKEVEPRSYRVSLRSDGSVDVAAVASSFGGGGHPRAAGCAVSGGLEEVRRRVLEALRSGAEGVAGADSGQEAAGNREIVE